MRVVVEPPYEASIRVHKDDREKFNAIRLSLGLQQHQFFTKLLEHWETTKVKAV